MTTQPDIKESITSLLNRGFEVPDIKDHLLKAGYSVPEIDQAFVEVNKQWEEPNSDAVTTKRAIQGFIWIVTGLLALLLIFLGNYRGKMENIKWMIGTLAFLGIAYGIFIVTRPLKRSDK